MTFNSSFEVLAEHSIQTPFLYSSSATNGSSDAWIQPSIISQALEVGGLTIIDGIYAQTPPIRIDTAVSPSFELELEAWEMASDEALVIFESQLD